MWKTILISLLIVIFSLPFLVSFLYSAASLCENYGCGMCGKIAHHINKWVGFFTNVYISESQTLIYVLSMVGLILVIVFFLPKAYFHREFFHVKHRIFNLSDSILINPIKRLYIDTKINPQIYS